MSPFRISVAAAGQRILQAMSDVFFGTGRKDGRALDLY
jgi:hypothetical protein